MKEERTARAWRYSSERAWLSETACGRGAREWFSCEVLEVAEALQGAEDFVADFGLDADEVEGGYVDGAAGADGLAGDVEELPVEVEAFVGAEEVAGEDEVDEEFFADAERVELLRRRWSSASWMGGRRARSCGRGGRRWRRRGRSRRAGATSAGPKLTKGRTTMVF